MFGSKKSKNNAATDSVSSIGRGTQGMVGHNQIGNGTRIEGDISCEGDIRIEGELKGVLRADARVVVGESGVITGDVFCQNADISGLVKGTITVSDQLFLKQTAKVEGDIVTQKLIVESGAILNGRCSMGPNSAGGNAKKANTSAQGAAAKS